MSTHGEFPIGSVWAPRKGKGCNRRVVRVDGLSWPRLVYVDADGAEKQHFSVKFATFRRWAGERVDAGGGA